MKCDVCDGNGKVKDLRCRKCLGDGEVDWIENVVGKRYTAKMMVDDVFKTLTSVSRDNVTEEKLTKLKDVVRLIDNLLTEL